MQLISILLVQITLNGVFRVIICMDIMLLVD